jgi:hypothetical protein
MSVPSIRHRTSQTSATSSEPSEPSVPQRTSRHQSKASRVVDSNNSSSTRVLRRRKNKPTTVKWLDSSRKSPRATTEAVTTRTQQQQDDSRDTDNSTMLVNQSDTDSVPSVIISSVNASPSENNNMIDHESTSDIDSSTVSDENNNVHDHPLTTTDSMPKRAKKNDPSIKSELLGLFHKPEDGAYTCKLCSKV